MCVCSLKVSFKALEWGLFLLNMFICIDNVISFCEDSLSSFFSFVSPFHIICISLYLLTFVNKYIYNFWKQFRKIKEVGWTETDILISRGDKVPEVNVTWVYIVKPQKKQENKWRGKSSRTFQWSFVLLRFPQIVTNWNYFHERVKIIIILLPKAD